MANKKQINTNLKPVVVFLSSLVAMGIFIFSTLLATLVCTKWYGLLIGVALMLIAITEGEILEGFDVGGGESGKKSKKNK